MDEGRMTIYVVSAFDSVDTEATVTCFDNENSAVLCLEYMKTRYEYVHLDAAPLYSHFYYSKEDKD